MAIVFQLVDNAPDRLRYLATQDGVISSPPVAADGFNTIPNNGGGSPDLRTDSVAVGGIAGASGNALLRAIRARLDGFGPLAPGALNQAQARAICNSDDAASAVLTNDLVGRCIVEVQPRLGNPAAPTSVIAWAVDINVDGNGDPVIEVRSEVGTPGTAYVDFYWRDSYEL